MVRRQPYLPVILTLTPLQVSHPISSTHTFIQTTSVLLMTFHVALAHTLTEYRELPLDPIPPG